MHNTNTIRKYALLLIVSVFLTTLFLPLQQASATYPGVNGVIVYTTPGEGLITINPFTKEETPLLNTAFGLTDPSWSPDGQTIAFSSNMEDGDHEIYTVRRDGTGLKRLTYAAGADGMPSFSPDGKKIAFHSARNGGGIDDYEIYVMDADGENQDRVTEDGIHDWAPVWHPSGDHLLYASRHNGSQYLLYTIRIDGTDKTLAASEDPLYSMLIADYSPDGKFIVYTRQQIAGGASTNDIWLMKSDGGEASKRPLTDNNVLDHRARFSPDGKRLVFYRSVAGNNEIHTMNLSDLSTEQITFEGAQHSQFASWQPLSIKPSLKPGVHSTVPVSTNGTASFAILDNMRDAYDGLNPDTVALTGPPPKHGTVRLDGTTIVYEADPAFRSASLPDSPSTLSRVHDWLFPSAHAQSSQNLIDTVQFTICSQNSTELCTTQDLQFVLSATIPGAPETGIGPLTSTTGTILGTMAAVSGLLLTAGVVVYRRFFG